MENIKEYNDFVAVQDTLKVRALAVANLLNDLYPQKYEMYSTEAEEIHFYEDEIIVDTGATFRGSYDSTSLDFKAELLFMTLEQITERITNEITDDKAKELAKVAEDAKKKADKELAKEKEEFERLKKKFG